MEQNTQHSNTHAAALRLGARHGYRIDGDFASLNAELSGSDLGAHGANGWALQLWACDEPYAGGALSGIKVAEAPLELSGQSDLSATQLDAEAFAHIPAAQRDYSMVLVLASGTAGSFAQVHDFANYPARQRFVAPHLDGTVGYRLLDDNRVALSSQNVVNPRDVDNLSGSLSLQLWALDEAYRGGVLQGHLLASAQLGRLLGQETLSLDEQWLSLSAPPQGNYSVALVLCEWTAAGYLTRDYCNFAERYAGPTLAVESTVAPSEPALKLVKSAPEPELKLVEKVAESKAAEKPVERKVVEKAELKAAEKPVELKAVAKIEAKPVEKIEAKPVEKIEAKPVEAARPAAVAPVAEAKAVAVPKPSEPTAVAEAKPAVADATQPAALLSLQTATLEQLSQVPGINKKLASEIIKARPFKSLDELSRVRGLGEKSIRGLRALLKI